MLEQFAPPLSHDPLCTVCGHAGHLITCGDECACEFPPVPGITL